MRGGIKKVEGGAIFRVVYLNMDGKNVREQEVDEFIEVSGWKKEAENCKKTK